MANQIKVLAHFRNTKSVSFGKAYRSPSSSSWVGFLYLMRGITMERKFTSDGWENININGESHTAQIIRIDDEKLLFMLEEENLMKCPSNCHIEHLNGKTLDNRKQNLRIKMGPLSIDRLIITGMENKKIESISRVKDDAGNNFYSVNTVLAL
jgi:hypothetical protein